VTVAPTRRYVALGDSYTIGTSIDPTGSWPAQLVLATSPLSGPGPLELVQNLAVNGFTSDDLIRYQLPQLAGLQPEFASVLIGVNDLVGGVPASAYQRHIGAIFEILRRRLPANRIVTVSTPDYTVTPRGGEYGDPGHRHGQIAAFNALMARESAEQGIRHVDIFDLSARAATDRSLVAADGLHPSAEQYRLWVERIAPVVVDLLSPHEGRSVASPLELQ